MSKFLTALIVSVLSFNVYAADRVVILAPAAGDIVQKLGAEDKVVGVTKSMDGFEKAARVGSHLKPNVEIIKSLRPDLLIVSKGKYFTDEMKDKIGVRTYEYDPKTLGEVINCLRELGKEFSKADAADSLEKSLRSQLSGLKKPQCRINVFFEVSQMPLMAAGRDSIVEDVITKAGGALVPDSDKKLYKTNIETVLISRPDVYIYQTGAMNKNPEPPETRAEYKNLKSRFIQVDESDYSRANTNSFSNVIFLNRVFNGFCDSQK